MLVDGLIRSQTLKGLVRWRLSVIKQEQFWVCKVTWNHTWSLRGHLELQSWPEVECKEPHVSGLQVVCMEIVVRVSTVGHPRR